ncbi:uncharacterized protein LOC122315195 isoform X1 [Carya illinoinensis]|uniref:Uncharacterized protein n=2 Tax=Carya illinoinensis TaxID=32201 RepID=A0A8T1PVQ5_CARIL|nr:uncharacterized protein LOC122315195 isoform X1 [Carya illinoinensis]XP_042986923.1 uncharacterized protein LOC122315195 isoform X1 [Carya illinoinensis]XP_042986924.1 uncharacterized protein LOC122315195 isoform X1 [Carya illinoinensis]KAG6646295.1 hypothetical protein CIPAW_07G000800 [Carya illinoinensis]KAG6646297.1 hypothetical protein CIPAW_07G000800 [Carya illinoinensis]KAG6646298.1 hypothetical protein CIPAW_07G000800 [Carya illinoinensis]KAG6646299.1 hypothetical protein CIPAW_07G0
MGDNDGLEDRPGIFMVGSSNVGKRTLLSRLMSVDFDDACDSSSEVVVHGWIIHTKYYTAEVSVCMAHLHDGFSIGTLPMFNRLAALVMVFDMSDLSSFVALQDWVACTDIRNFEILLCIGNKVDLLSGHPAHAEYRRHLQNLGDLANSDAEFTEYGISESEGSGLLGNEELSWEIRRSCLEWCSEHNIEFIEACASNADFDKCLSVDGDSQGVDRLYGALSAYMWPGMILKSGNQICKPSLPGKEELSSGESDYEFEYEILSAGSAEPWDDMDKGWVSANGITSFPDRASHDRENVSGSDEEKLQPSTSMAPLQDENDLGVIANACEKATEADEGTHFDFEDLEQLMSEIGNMRDSLRLMPDFQRREMAAKLAMKMASMFGDGSDDDDDHA